MAIVWIVPLGPQYPHARQGMIAFRKASQHDAERVTGFNYLGVQFELRRNINCVGVIKPAPAIEWIDG